MTKTGGKNVGNAQPPGEGSSNGSAGKTFSLSLGERAGVRARVNSN